MGVAGAGVAEAGPVDTGARAGHVAGCAGDEEVCERYGDQGRCAGYEECGCAVQFVGYGEGGGQCGVCSDTDWVEGA